MRCPFCTHEDTQVKDSRPSEDNAAIRRRRVCNGCGARFTTFERVQLRELTVIKNDTQFREPFDREKLLRSMRTPLRKRPVMDDQIEKLVTSIERQLESSGEAEITSKQIGEMVMQALAKLDKVAYVRYASVYKDFREVSDFNSFLDDMSDKKAKTA